MRGLDDPKHRSHIRLTAAQAREAERVRAIEDTEAAFPAPADATPDQLAAMAVSALRFDGRQLAAALGLSQRKGEALIAEPSEISPRQRALLAQFLEFSEFDRPARHARAMEIATHLRASLTSLTSPTEPPRVG